MGTIAEIVKFLAIYLLDPSELIFALRSSNFKRGQAVVSHHRSPSQLPILRGQNSESGTVCSGGGEGDLVFLAIEINCCLLIVRQFHHEVYCRPKRGTALSSRAPTLRIVKRTGACAKRVKPGPNRGLAIVEEQMLGNGSSALTGGLPASPLPTNTKS